ncbi:Glycoside hydrolase family 61 protein [Coniochaeta hoffmannii]|uniref:lytic cellulose monooxygenase (C4-dehydrogenating) n=1 Tax=Coniochaeta hoffmannii TaxID=91930 RepID=A0AA38RYP4_9PEZI|nr:Glycoside hydrolase family 61 protein [Coniochaeta hoffmannii]
MKSVLPAIAALSLAPFTSAHYIFQKLAASNVKFQTYEHIRYNTNYNSPVTDLASKDLRCNVGGASGSNTTTLPVKAGDPFTFTSDVAVYHQGPISLYMSKAPGKVADYDGSGGWFKIYDWGPTFNGGQASWPLRTDYTYNIPKCIKDGEYLLRIQSLAIHNPGSTPQFYVSCAQINVTGGSGTANPTTVSIPGAFKATDPGYTANIYNNFNSYTVPGPAPMTC